MQQKMNQPGTDEVGRARGDFGAEGAENFGRTAAVEKNALVLFAALRDLLESRIAPRCMVEVLENL